MTGKRSILLFGATGTIGKATARALLADGHAVTCVVRAESDLSALPQGVRTWAGHLDDFGATHMAGHDAVISCLASRTGAPNDAWAVDHDAHLAILRAAQSAGVAQFILLSAICVQKPQLAFQQAKLAFETALMDSGMTYSIVRPTAFFKSLSGQVARVQAGKPFMLFGDGELTACKPISDRDLGRYLSLCLTDKTLHNRVLPIGGPGPALTPKAQGKMIFDLAGKPHKFKSIPVAFMDAIIAALKVTGVVVPALRRKADFARIGRYYATESMLVWRDNRYDAAATPEFGSDRIEDHYRAMIAGEVTADLGDHAMF